MKASSQRAVRAAAIAAATLGAGLVLPAACLFPQYTFDLQNTGGTGGATSSSSSTGHGGGGSGPTSSSTTGSTGGGGSGGTGGATTSSTSSSTSGGPTCPSMDCSDPACQPTMACVPAVPTDWTGYVELYDGPAAGDPGCGGNYPMQAFIGNGGFSATPATCSQCTCGNPQGVTCVVPSTVSIGDAACNNAPFCGADLPTDWSAPCTTTMQSPYLMGGALTCGSTANATCSTSTGSPCNVSVTMGTTSVTGGSCQASTVVATKPPPTWQAVGEACGGGPTTGVGCSGSQVCMPKPAAGFGQKLCIMKAGNNSCPAGQFTQQHVFFTGFKDSRDCSPCSCGGASGSTCSAKVDIYTSYNACTGAPAATLNLDTNAGACAALSGNPQIAGRKATTTTPTGGSCPASGGQAIGTAAEDPATATTFCCIP